MNERTHRSLMEYDALRATKQMQYNSGILSEDAYLGFLLEEDTLFKIMEKNGVTANACSKVKKRDI